MIPLYLDCDTGVDDALALGYLLAAPDVDLVGIGTVSGNTSAAQAARNTLDLLSIAGRDGIPVAVGAHDHLTHPYGGGAALVHGGNGIGGAELARSAAEPVAGSAVELLLGLSHRYAGSLRILAVGPFTNLALALQSDPTLPARVASVTLMGGAALVPGNIGAVSEANVHNDPEAAQVVLEADWDVTLVPLDVTMEHTFNEDDRLALTRGDRPLAPVLAGLLDVYLDYYEPVFGRRSCALHDPVAAVVAVGGLALRQAPRVPVVVDTGSGPGRGQTIADLRGQRAGAFDHDVRTRVVMAMDGDVAGHLLAALLRA